MLPEKLVVVKKNFKVNGKGKDMLSQEQLAAVKKHFKVNIDNRKLPGKADCERMLKMEASWKGKDWLKIKCTVRNEIEKKKRQIKRLQNN